MLCLLAFGNHEALTKSVKTINRSTITIGALKRLAVIPPSLPLLERPRMLCLLAFGDHEALIKSVKTILVGGLLSVR